MGASVVHTFDLRHSLNDFAFTAQQGSANTAEFESPEDTPTRTEPRLLDGSRFKRNMTRSDSKFGLTAREVEIVSAVIAGLSNREIAQKYGLSQATVRHHLTRIYAKLRVGNRGEPQTPLDYLADVVRKLLDYLAKLVKRFWRNR